MPLMNVRRVDKAPNSSDLQKGPFCAENISSRPFPFVFISFSLCFATILWEKGKVGTEQSKTSKNEEVTEKFQWIFNGERLRNFVAR